MYGRFFLLIRGSIICLNPCTEKNNLLYVLKWFFFFWRVSSWVHWFEFARSFRQCSTVCLIVRASPLWSGSSRLIRHPFFNHVCVLFRGQVKFIWLGVFLDLNEIKKEKRVHFRILRTVFERIKKYLQTHTHTHIHKKHTIILNNGRFYFLFFSQEKSEEASDPVVDRVEAVQVEASAFPAAHPGPGFVQKVPGLHGPRRPRTHRVLQAVQTRLAAQLRHVRPQQLLPPAVIGWIAAAARSRVRAVPRTRARNAVVAVPRTPRHAAVPAVRVAAGRAPPVVRTTVQQQAGQESAGHERIVQRFPAAFGLLGGI